MYKKNTVKFVEICLIIILFFAILTGISVAKKNKYKNESENASPSFSEQQSESNSVISSQKEKLKEQSEQEEKYKSEQESVSQRIETLKSKVSKYSTTN